MFFVINKENLVAYIVSIATVLVLFSMAGTLNTNSNTLETGADIQNENSINNNLLYNNNTSQDKEQ